MPSPKKKPKRGPRNIVSIYGTEEWREWLNNLAHHCRLRPPDLIDRALIAYAKQEGFADVPPSRFEQH